MATYGTDLTTLTDAESGTWVELTNYAQGSTPAASGENFIQGVDCQSQTTGQKTGESFSIMFDNGSGVSWTSGDVFLVWQYYSIGVNLAAYASGGLQVAIYSTLTAGDRFDTGGSNRAPYPAGAWQNAAVDPERAHDRIEGAGNAGTYRYIGSVLNHTVKITKGDPHAVDAIRYGRGEIYCTGIAPGANFTDMAAYNDANTSGNYRRLGLFEDTGGGTFLWKGLMSLGQSGTSVSFTDSNKSITIDDAAKTYQAFNKIEIRHTSSTVTWTNISFFALGTVSPGQFEMVENATVNMTGCAFNNMDTFIFLSNGAVTSCNFVGCGQITHGGADFEACNFEGYEGTSDSAYLIYNGTTDINGEIDNCSFTKGTAATHAISFTDNTTVEHTLTGVAFSGYGAEGSTSAALYFPDSGSDIDWIINLSGCSGTINFKKVRAGDTVTIVADQTTHTLSGLVNNSEVTYAQRGTAIDTGSDGATTVGSRNFVTGNAWTTDEHKGFLLEITSGADAGRYYVYGNNATTLFLDTEMGATASSLTYELYDENDDTVLFHVENVTGNQTDYLYTYVSDEVVDIIIHNQDYVTIVLEKITLGNTDVDLPQNQVLDDNYFNP